MCSKPAGAYACLPARLVTVSSVTEQSPALTCGPASKSTAPVHDTFNGKPVTAAKSTQQVHVRPPSPILSYPMLPCFMRKSRSSNCGTGFDNVPPAANVQHCRTHCAASLHYASAAASCSLFLTCQTGRALLPRRGPGRTAPPAHMPTAPPRTAGHRPSGTHGGTAAGASAANKHYMSI